MKKTDRASAGTESAGTAPDRDRCDLHLLRLRLRRYRTEGRGRPDRRGQAGLRAGHRLVPEPRRRTPSGLPDQRAGGPGRGRRRARGTDPGRGAVPAGLRPERYHRRVAADGRRHRRLDRGEPRHHDQRLPRADRHGLPGRGRSHVLAGRGPQPGRPGHLLGAQSRREPPAALHPLQLDAQGHVRAARAEGPHLRGRGRPQDEDHPGGRRVHRPETARRLRGPVDAAGAGQGRRARPGTRARGNRAAAVRVGGSDAADEGRPVRRDVLRHGADHDPRQTRQYRGRCWPSPAT